MNLLVIGLNHRSAPVEVRERLAFCPQADRLADPLRSLKSDFGLDEVVILSTCNRTEIYVSAADSAAAKAAVTRFLEARAVSAGVSAHLYAYDNAAAVRHLFRVAAGLDSMVVGEHEVLGQVKNAYVAAHAAGTTGKLMNVLFQRSLFVGKRVRTETGIALGSASVGSVAVTMAERIFGSLSDRTVMILGAGKMAELTAKHLLSQKVHSILVSNRTYERACELAKQLGGQALRFDEGLEHMEETDIVICSTAAPHPIIGAEQVRALMQRRKGRSLFFIDIAVPRDVHPDVHQIDNVYVYNIDDLQAIISENIAKRGAEIQLAGAIVDAKTEEFGRWLTAYHTGQSHSFQHDAVATTRNA